MFLLVKISLIKKTDPKCLSQQFCLIARFIHGCSTAACLISQPFFFFFPGFFPNTWQLPDVLSSAPILEQLLLLLQPASHTQSTPSKGERGASDTFSSVLPHLCPPPFAQEHPKQFYFHFSISIFGVLREKKNILSPAHHLCHYCFFLPCVLYFLVRELFCVPTVFFHQCCCVCIPREAVADFHPIALTPVALGVSPVWSCT